MRLQPTPSRPHRLEGGGSSGAHTKAMLARPMLRITAPQRRDLMEIVEDRYGRGSTLITSQLPLDKWHDVIGDPTFADAILDRIVHNAYRLELDGPSMRKLKATEQETTYVRQAEGEARAAAKPAAKPAKADQK